MRFIAHFGPNHLSRIISDWMALARFWSYLTQNATYSVAKGVNFNSDMALRVEISEDQGLSKCLSQLDKCLSSIES